MKLRKFMGELSKIAAKHGDDLEVTMADFKPVVTPCVVYDSSGTTVIVTDMEDDESEVPN
ncbi:hypothetical protein JW899_01220 [Candidatus Uhrbacteria bacterium]|nr:hypothetical protein [Candidatus Uhrbacteria bacterium]